MKRFRLALALLPILLTNAALSAEASDPIRGISGILPLPEVFGVEPCDHFKAQDVEIFQSPSSSKRIGRIYVSKPWTFSPSGGCEGLEVSVAIDEPVQRREKLPTLEFSYEQPGAIVRRRRGEWFEIALTRGHAWVHIHDDGKRHLPVEQLLKGSLTYLTGQGPVAILEKPGHGKPVWYRKANIPSNLPVEVTGFQEIGGQLWVQVHLLNVEPCSGKSTGVTPASGWMPLHDKDGMPAIWFYSRGC